MEMNELCFLGNKENTIFLFKQQRTAVNLFCFMYYVFTKLIIFLMRELKQSPRHLHKRLLI